MTFTFTKGVIIITTSTAWYVRIFVPVRSFFYAAPHYTRQKMCILPQLDRNSAVQLAFYIFYRDSIHFPVSMDAHIYHTPLTPITFCISFRLSGFHSLALFLLQLQLLPVVVVVPFKYYSPIHP